MFRKYIYLDTERKSANILVHGCHITQDIIRTNIVLVQKFATNLKRENRTACTNDFTLELACSNGEKQLTYGEKDSYRVTLTLATVTAPNIPSSFEMTQVTKFSQMRHKNYNSKQTAKACANKSELKN